ncbi:MAG: preprotein translocase subunit SecE [Caldisericia bacterium]|nr:preprotein translocase subunit SecE [Caldisericia bacterium]MDD4614249.1 preprotein translocase subunit SecE [Caldisericia bacterium]
MKKHTNKFIQFFIDVWYEIVHKTTWPSFSRLWQTTLIVVLFVTVWSAFLGIVDTGFAKAMESFMRFVTGG